MAEYIDRQIQKKNQEPKLSVLFLAEFISTHGAVFRPNEIMIGRMRGVVKDFWQRR